MKPLSFGIMGIVALMTTGHSALGKENWSCFPYPAVDTPLAKLEGDWYVQDYANAGSVFENQTCIKISFDVAPHGHTAKFNKTWVDKWTKQVQYAEFIIVQCDLDGIVFLKSNDKSWKISAHVLSLTSNGTFIHSSCEINGTQVLSQRITTATRKRQVDREDWLKIYEPVNNNGFQSHLAVDQSNCTN